MKQISSRATFFHKYIMPIICLAVFFLFLNSSPWDTSDPVFLWLTFAIPVLLVITQVPVWRSADAVYDCGDHLLVRKGAVDARIPLANINRVREHGWRNPRRITLLLGVPCPFGDRISFLPQYEARLLFMRGTLARELTHRVEQAHVRRGL